MLLNYIRTRTSVICRMYFVMCVRCCGIVVGDSRTSYNGHDWGDITALGDTVLSDILLLSVMR